MSLKIKQKLVYNMKNYLNLFKSNRLNYLSYLVLLPGVGDEVLLRDNAPFGDDIESISIISMLP